MQIQETQAENTTPVQAMVGATAPEFDGTPAREVIDLRFHAAPNTYAVTLEDGEVLYASTSPNGAIVATLAYAFKTGRRVEVGRNETWLVAVRLDPVKARRPAVANPRRVEFELALEVEELARGLFRAAGLQACCEIGELTFDTAEPNVRATFRAAALAAVRKLDVYRFALAVEQVRQSNLVTHLPTETIVRLVDQALAAQDAR